MRNLRDVRLGETGVSNSGFKMRIFYYKNARDIGVEFEDGTRVYKRTYANFKAGVISKPNFHSSLIKSQQKHIGEEVLTKDNKVLRIIAYRGCYDIDVQFDDGSVRQHVRYDRFKKGSVRYPK